MKFAAEDMASAGLDALAALPADVSVELPAASSASSGAGAAAATEETASPAKKARKTEAPAGGQV